MKAVVLHAPGDIGVDDVSDPRVLEPDDAIVAVSATAICGADLFPFHGLTPGFEPGTVLGHEFAGEVVEVGPGVQRVRPGQRVVNASMISDGTCPSCRAGRVTQCKGRSLFGYSGVYPRLDGGQAELVRVPQADRALRPLPDDVSDEAAVFLADILPTGHGAVVRSGDGQPRAGERQGRVRRVDVERLDVEADPVAVERNRAVDVRDGEDRTRAPGAQLCVWPPSATMS